MGAGRLYGVGLGPGDPELVTVKAARLVERADVIAYHSARHGRSIARSVAEPYLRAGQIEEALVYPVTTETTEHPGGYRGALDEFYAECAARLAAHLDAGRDVVVLCEGDPFFYGSYMHIHKRLSHRYTTEVVPGVTSVSGAAAVLGRPLVERDEVLTVLPGTLPPDELARHLEGADPAAVLKLGRTFGAVREALDSAGRLDEAWYVERATTDRQRVVPLSEVDPESVPYFALAVLPSRVAAVPPPSVAATRQDGHGEVAVVGLGPAGREWTTPEAQAVLAEADDLVGYGPYLDRVPPNPRQRRHPSDNTEEAARAAYALDLAAAGSRVAVVSSGTRVCSRWRARCWRWPPSPGTRTCRCVWCPGSPPPRPWRAGSVRRWGTTTACCPFRTGSSRGTSSPSGSPPPPAPTWSSPSTTRPRAPGPGRWRRPATCFSNTGRRTRRWSSGGT
ncbi:hypothetical protein Pflav_005740 [Phytohabitans flavus]|uniref:Tetrapyrrole methylase domain-containing protein n=1 Tax=Phytohabitans flavus TaxID=1076124 RepID=A0A6F8XK23_9ACTN|nr:hypothetical protein Pflav_005740 [Phytohabitans flavus]